MQEASASVAACGAATSVLLFSMDSVTFFVSSDFTLSCSFNVSRTPPGIVGVSLGTLFVVGKSALKGSSVSDIVLSILECGVLIKSHHYHPMMKVKDQSVALSHKVILFVDFTLFPVRVMASSSVQELPKVLNVSLLELLEEQNFVHWSINSNGSIISVLIRFAMQNSHDFNTPVT